MLATLPIAPNSLKSNSLDWQPLPWQKEPFEDTSPIQLLHGGAGAGRSTCVAWKLHWFCLMFPGAVVIVGRKTQESCKRSMLPLFLNITKAKDKNNPICELKNGRDIHYYNKSVIYFFGMKDKSQRELIKSIGSEENPGVVDIAWMEEADQFEFLDFELVLTRLRGKATAQNGKQWNQVILTTNPSSPYHWIFTKLILGKINRKKEDIYIKHATYLDNPHNPKKYGSDLLSLSFINKQRMALGKWVQAEGVVYPEFSIQTHTINTMPENWQSWRKIRAIDFGFNHPFVCHWIALSPNNEMYTYREIYMSGIDLDTHCQLILDLSIDDGYIETTVCDHALAERNTLSRYGIINIAAGKSIIAGIDIFRTWLKINPATNKPRYFWLNNCTFATDYKLEKAGLPTSALQEFTLYAYPSSENKSINRDMPIKQHDHGMDTARYAAVYFGQGMIDWSFLYG